MRSLGRPNREQIVSTRPDRLTTLQALDLSNGDVMGRLTTDGAKSLLKKNPDWESKEIVTVIYGAGLGRDPSAEELAIAKEILGTKVTEASLADLLWTIFMLPEFQLIR